MEIHKNTYDSFKPAKVKVITFKKYLEGKEEIISSYEEPIENLTELILLTGQITQFNKEEEEKLQHEGFDENYILMKKIIR